MKLNDKTYDILNLLVRYWLPAAGTFYFAIAQIWNLPHGEAVTGSFLALATFIGAVIGISRVKYHPETPPSDIYPPEQPVNDEVPPEQTQ